MLESSHIWVKKKKQDAHKKNQPGTVRYPTDIVKIAVGCSMKEQEKKPMSV